MVRVNFVTVYTLDKNWLTVYEELCVLDFNLAETYVLRDNFNHLVSVLECSVELVKVWSLCCPLERVIYSEVSFSLTASDCGSFLSNNLTCFVLESHNDSLAVCVVTVNLYCKSCVLVVLIEVRSNEDVADVALRTCVEVAFACDTAKAPEVLVLEVTTVAPAHNLHSNEVLLAWFDEFRNVKFSSNLSVLAVTYILAVDVNSDVASSRADVHVDLVALPVCRDAECLAVRTYVVVLVLNVRRISFPIVTPSVLVVNVDCFAVSVHFPVSWHRHCAPL